MLAKGNKGVPVSIQTHPANQEALPQVIAIDGPAGAGKSTLGLLLAQRLGYLYFDTGVMYRALTLVALGRNLDLADRASLEALAEQIAIEVLPPTIDDGRQCTVLAEGVDVTWEIRRSEVNQHVSLASSHPGVRREMVRRQQAIGERGRVVMVGRDIGTVVMPNAELKIFLEASLEERARRRHDEELQRGQAQPLDQVLADLARRDQADRHVMRPADDAVVLQSDGLSPTHEVDWVLNYLHR